MQLPIYILAGGKSSRFGSDKARAIIEDETLLQRIAKQVQSVASRITVVAQHDGQYDDLGLHTIGDAQPNLGPMGGLTTALRDLQRDEQWLCLLSCDLLEVKPAWLQTLWAQRKQSHVIAFRPDYWQPMLAIYHRDVSDAVAAKIASGHRSMQRLLDETGAFAATLPSDWPKVLQVNTPGDIGSDA